MSYGCWRDGILELRLVVYAAGERIDERELQTVLVDPTNLALFDSEYPDFLTCSKAEKEKYDAADGNAYYTGSGNVFNTLFPEVDSYVVSDREFWGIECDSVRQGGDSGLLEEHLSEDGLAGLIGSDSVLDREIADDLLEAWNAHKNKTPRETRSVSVLYLASGWASESHTCDGDEYDNGISLTKFSLADINVVVSH